MVRLNQHSTDKGRGGCRSASLADDEHALLLQRKLAVLTGRSDCGIQFADFKG